MMEEQLQKTKFDKRKPAIGEALTLDAVKRELYAGLLNRGLKFGQGVDRQGKTLSWLLDCREVLLIGRYLRHAARLLWELLRPYQPTRVGGMTMSADPLIIALIQQAWQEDYELEGFIVRPEPKAHGLRKRVEGPAIAKGDRLVVVDDLLNSGKTLKQTLAALTPFEAQIVAVGTIINYERSGARWLQQQQLPLLSLFTLADLGMVYRTAERGGEDRNARPFAPLWTWEPLNTGEYGAPKSSPCLADGLIYVGSDQGFLLALTDTGSERWRYQVRDTQWGIHSSPAVYQGKVYFGAYDGWVYCLDAVTGVLHWEVRPGQWIGSSPAIDEQSGLLYIGIEYGKRGGSLIALNAHTGQLVWNCQLGHYVHASPWLDLPRKQVIIGANDGRVCAIDAATGHLRWQFPTAGEVKGRPIVDAEGQCFVTSFDGCLYTLDAATGLLRWQRRLAQRLYTNPLLYHDLVITGGHTGRVVALERQTGAIRWVTTTEGRVLGGMAVIRDREIILGSADGRVYVLQGDSGIVEWQYQTGGPIRTTPGVGTGLCIVPSCDGNLYAFSTDPQQSR